MGWCFTIGDSAGEQGFKSLSKCKNIISTVCQMSDLNRESSSTSILAPLESCICVNFRSLFSNDKCKNIVTYVCQMSTLNQAGFRLLFHSDKSWVCVNVKSVFLNDTYSFNIKPANFFSTFIIIGMMWLMTCKSSEINKMHYMLYSYYIFKLKKNLFICEDFNFK